MTFQYWNYTVLDYGMTDEFKRIWKEVVVAQQTEEHHEKPHT
jgi:hypothetical protein